MKAIRVNLKSRSYQIVVGYGIINSIGKFISRLDIGQDAYIITNAVIKSRHGALLKKSLSSSGLNLKFKAVPDTEKSKSLNTLSSILNDIAAIDKNRRIFIVAFGGGVIGDLSGFIASVYKRGIPYIQLPTTLLAQVDSSIGGKTGIDLPQAKNLAGAIYQPRLVFSDVKLLNTLDRRQIRAGLAEVIKYAVIKDRQLFDYLEKNYKYALRLKPQVLEHIVTCCSAIKAAIVEKDEREEKGMRTILNFGHTVGHAIEAAANYKSYNHGEAIGLGMLAALDIGSSLGITSKGAAKRVEALLKAVGLPAEIKGIPSQKVINAHYHDKKFIGSKNRFVLISSIGKARVVENIPIGVIREAIKMRLP